MYTRNESSGSVFRVWRLGNGHGGLSLQDRKTSELKPLLRPSDLPSAHWPARQVVTGPDGLQGVCRWDENTSLGRQGSRDPCQKRVECCPSRSNRTRSPFLRSVFVWRWTRRALFSFTQPLLCLFTLPLTVVTTLTNFFCFLDLSQRCIFTHL
jgi:hypothetical protein